MSTENMGQILQAGTQLAGTAIANHGNKKRQEKAFGQQKELMGLQMKNQQQLNQEGYNLQKQMWEETNYPAQIAMMKQAGLNPSLMYGKGGGGGTTTGSQGGGSATGGSAPTMPTMETTGIQNMGMSLAGIKLAQAQARKTNAEAATLEADLPEVQSYKAGATRSKLQLESEKNKQDYEAITQKNLTQQDKDKGFTTLDQILTDYQKGQVAGYQQQVHEADIIANNKQISDETKEAQIKTLITEEAKRKMEVESIQAGTSLTKERERQIYHEIIQSYLQLGTGALKTIITKGK